MASKNTFKSWIIYEDDNLLMVNKPAGISSLHERNDTEITSVIGLARDYSGDIQLCHRLDRETSGCLLMAKTPETYRHIAMQFERRKIKKKYHAIVEGNIEFENLEVNLPLFTDSKRRVQVSHKNGKDSLTIFNTLKTYEHFSLIECEPVTGRLHQIRVHLASQNARIVADEQYGGKLPYLSRMKRKFKLSKANENESPILNRVALHSFSLGFEDIENKPMHFESAYPKDLEVFVKLLEKYDS
ncbi:MAG: RluA family pseudouridine synthase [Bacteroidia bacterium]|nr:RluA family pseudouridine synthase [Bacteroidia bacterium]